MLEGPEDREEKAERKAEAEVYRWPGVGGGMQCG